ncbi:MAG: molybdopterin-synthase adenylyltransferase MoeB [Vicinamibacteria bacterium]|nr:molybdopterin-synthase adenylyltransferase MoeB [Vicinamibacteria bacterium]
MSELSRSERARYARHLVLPEVGPEGQQRLRAGRVLVVGAGGLGSPAALYLAAAGVGRIGIADGDQVELSNLQRQILHTDADVGRSKTASARAALQARNPLVEVEELGRLDAATVADAVERFDVVVDGSDNFTARYLLNDACVRAGRPYVFGAVHRFQGQVAVFGLAGGPCYRCLHPEPPPPGLVASCAEAGVLGVLPGVIGSLQAAEALKLLLGLGEPLSGRMLIFDALAAGFDEIALARDPRCPACGDAPRPEARVVPLEACAPPPPLSVHELRRRLAGDSPPALVDVRTPGEHALGHLPGSRSIPLDELEARLEELRAGGALVVYCQSGVRSARAAALLRSAGLASVSDLAGGYLAWQAAGPAATP